MGHRHRRSRVPQHDSRVKHDDPAAAGQQLFPAARGIAGLAEYPTGAIGNLVRSEHQVVGKPRRNGFGFRPREPQRKRVRGLIRQGLFGDPGRFGPEWQAEARQEGCAVAGSGGENQAAGHAMSS